MTIDQSQKEFLMSFPMFIESLFRLADHFKNPEVNLHSSIICFIEDIVMKKAHYSTCEILKLFL